MIDLKPREPGVYFGLPDEEYFDAYALGYSDLKLLARSPADWWWQSKYNPLREPPKQDSDGKRFGRALHLALLVGMDAYKAAYFIRPEAPADAIKTVDDLKAALDAAGADYRKSWPKPKLASALAAVQPDLVIYDDWLEEQRQAQGEREEIPEKWDQAIRLMEAIVRNHPDLSRAFSGGMPEVSVFWEEDGVPFRVRFDYLKPHGVFDLKSLSNWRARDYRTACIDEMRRYSYGVQGVHYHDGRARAAQMIAEGRVFGDVDKTFLDNIVKAAKYEFIFVFMQTLGSPRALPVRFPNEGTIAGEMRERVERAVHNFRTFRDRFGSEMWIETDSMWQPSDEELAPLMWSQA